MHHAHDGGFETVGHLQHLRLALLLGANFLFGLFGLHPFHFNGVFLEDLDRLGHGADLVLAVRAKNLNRLVALGKLVHDARQRVDRAGDGTYDSKNQESRYSQQRECRHCINQKYIPGFVCLCQGGFIQGGGDEVLDLLHQIDLVGNPGEPISPRYPAHIAGLG